MGEAKIFVGGLSWETTQDSLKEYFEGFGQVIDVSLKTDPETGKSRGFGFLTFADPATVKQVINHGDHMLDNRKIDPKVAKARDSRGPGGGGGGSLKVFVGGLDPEVSEEEIRSHFGQYGTVDEVDLPYDKVANQRRAFCFVKFNSEDAVNSVLANSKQMIGNSEVTVKKATPKSSDGGYGQDGGYGGGRGGRGGGRGRGGYGGGDSYGNGGGGGYGGAGGYGGGYGGGGSYGAGGYGGAAGYGSGGYGGYDSQSYGGSGGYGGSSYGGASGGGSHSYHPYQR